MMLLEEREFLHSLAERLRDVGVDRRLWAPILRHARVQLRAVIEHVEELTAQTPCAFCDDDLERDLWLRRNNGLTEEPGTPCGDGYHVVRGGEGACVYCGGYAFDRLDARIREVAW